MAKQLLSKAQRHTAYIILLAELDGIIKNDPEIIYDTCKYRLCQIVFKFLGIDNTGMAPDFSGVWFWDAPQINSIRDCLIHLPELMKKKPVNGWPCVTPWTIKLRKKWLQECINETYNF